MKPFKLTLSADPRTVEVAKAMAAEQGTSVSAMFERVVKLMAHQHRKRPRLGAIARRATGLVALPKGMEARIVLEDALLERHGLR
jgi:hypothetical protein